MVAGAGFGRVTLALAGRSWGQWLAPGLQGLPPGSGLDGPDSAFAGQLLGNLGTAMGVGQEIHRHGWGNFNFEDFSMTQASLDETALTWKRHAEQVAGQHWPEASLYVVATPIGNLGDLSLRAWEALRRCDAIAAEDTRTTRQLLDAWGISTPLMAAHRHNEQQAAELIIQRLSGGERIALVSDAGAPAVSDPGARIVRQVQAAGYRVVPLPGPSAVVAALMASGATRDEDPGFAFAGFMPSKPLARRKWLARWLGWTIPVVLFETPHRLQAALEDLRDLAGPDRVLTLARELSKRFEEIHTLPLGQVAEWLAQDAHRTQGEFVLILHAAPATAEFSDDLSPDQLRVMQALLAELSVRDAARIGAAATGVPRDRLYQWALRQSP